MTETTDVRRSVPRTDDLLREPRLADAAERLGREIVRAAIMAAQDRARRGEIAPEEVSDAVVAVLPSRATSLRPVLNATGVLVHTNLGRAPLSLAARAAVAAVAGSTDVEFDLATGRRASRGQGVRRALAAAVPAAGDVHVVNNNAAALALAATALASDREIVVSRGELVEIGDGFRLPDLLESTGARLREVGTTNRTSLEDYRAAIGPKTGFLLKVHPSNFRVEGFTRDVAVAQLSTLGPPVVADIGSGLLRPDALLPDEPDADSALAAGAALVTASGDKLLGGPQAGLLLGQADVVERLRRHPLARALRVDKLTLAALEATLIGPQPPVQAALHTDIAGLERRAWAIHAALVRAGVPANVDSDRAVIGGGGAPGVELESRTIRLAANLAEPLRLGDPAVVGRVDRGALVIDLRSLPPEDDEALVAAILTAAA
jgi:L-seryl-tRNA(Ser) seleniumtransferase